MEDVKEKVRRLKHLHAMQVNQIDLNLETTPRDSRYSNALMENMKREEVMLARDPANPSTRALIAKVDEGLRQETQAFFNKLSLQNIKRWEKMHAKMRSDRQQLMQEISTRYPSLLANRNRNTANNNNSSNNNNNNNNINNTNAERKEYTMEDIEAEAERLQADYLKSWHRYETYHLNAAFRSQLSRIDADWAAHEREIQTEYANKRAAITGSRASASNANNNSNDSSAQEASRWQHPEKQKTLIHTAPVFSPQRPTSAKVNSANSAKKAQNNAAELEKIEREYRDAMAALEMQKVDAKRWLLRQQARLSVQSDEVAKEKVAMGTMLDEDIAELNQMVQQLGRQ